MLNSRHPSPPQDYVPHAKAFSNYKASCEATYVIYMKSYKGEKFHGFMKGTKVQT